MSQQRVRCRLNMRERLLSDRGGLGSGALQECASPPPPQELAAEGSQLQQHDPLRPFSLKHARQQASIVGHMQRVAPPSTACL